MRQFLGNCIQSSSRRFRVVNKVDILTADMYAACKQNEEDNFVNQLQDSLCMKFKQNHVKGVSMNKVSKKSLT